MKLLIADDHDLLRETLSAYLERESGMDVMLAADYGEALRLVACADTLDLILLDLDMPGMNGIDSLAEMKTRAAAPVGIISGNVDRRFAERALHAGAAGFLPKTMSARSISHAVRLMAAGEIFVPAALLGPMTDAQASQSPLTERETQVLGYLAAGLSNKEIGRELDLQEVTIKLHVRTLVQKLGARNRTHAAVLGRDQNLI